ncbi:MAG: LysR substrate-binding domain-containing protein [Vreelandella alkaliphila]|uniref:LysR family transcriptional regulator n=1 Tax=Halomonas campaniensis TaxID=213554 RepID=A0A3D0KGE8_9GAMM|nr:MULTISPECIES: LysR substrate-binding domain-containing protein [unclassified Halomonas]ASK21526.1 LysR family transcriptional regulator [Halomonas sp. N3-2A]HBP40173.1 LysR family transcriptional regulator [Halomonas sp.]HBS82704.1 LysR family transcriptional regulator [Halomonas campaniensis]HCA02556.1 LysR family transcriptional regulator [Halomonas campaniensis]
MNQLSTIAPSRAALPLLDSEVLRTFVTIAESGSFTRAAQQLFRTPSALSMQIKRLEETLGQTLFVREARYVRLTTEGEVLLGYGRRLLKLNAEAVTQFLAPTIEGRVGLGITDDVVGRILPNVLAQFARSHPAVQVDVVVGRSKDLLARLDEGELDLALVMGGEPGQAARGDVVHSEPLVWAGREDGVAVERTPLPVTLAQQGCAWRRIALNALDHAGVNYRIAYSCDHCAGQEAAMLADLAVTAFPKSLIRPPLKRLNNDALPPLGDYQVFLVKRAGSSDASEVLAERVVEALREG